MSDKQSIDDQSCIALNTKTGSGLCNPVVHKTLILFLIVVGTGVRLYQITSPPLDFHPTWQYHSAIIARGIYYEKAETVLEWQKKAAEYNLQAQSQVGPRWLMKLAAYCYGIAGNEQLWIPRMLSVLVWVAGSVFVFLIVSKMFSINAAIFSLGFYLFAPFGIIASRSFQPDPIVVVSVILSVYMVLKYYDKPSVTRLIIAAAVSTIAAFLKPPFVLMILGAFTMLQFQKHGFRRFFFKLDTYLFPLLSVLPALLYYVFVIDILNNSPVHGVMPHMLTEKYFWRGWLMMVGQTAGLIPFGITLFVMVLYYKKPIGAILFGILAGNFVLGLMFPYQMHTHNYFELILVPVASIAIGPFIAIFIAWLSRRWSILADWVLSLTGVLLVTGAGIIFVLGSGGLAGFRIKCQNKLHQLSKYVWISSVYDQLLYSDFSGIEESAEEIGEVVDHSTNTIFLAEYYGLPLKYHGHISGTHWPTIGDISASKKIKPGSTFGDDIEKLFKEMSAQVSAEYFIITALKEFELQSGLQEYLDDRFNVISTNDQYIIYDLRKGLSK